MKRARSPDPPAALLPLPKEHALSLALAAEAASGLQDVSCVKGCRVIDEGLVEIYIPVHAGSPDGYGMHPARVFTYP